MPRAIEAFSSYRVSGVLSALVLLSGASASGAEANPSGDETVSTSTTLLEWDAPDGCPSAEAVYQSWTDVSGHAPDLARSLRIQGSITRHGAGWRLALDVSEAGRRRTRLIDAARCQDLADAAALAIHLALAPDGRAEATPDATGASIETPSGRPAGAALSSSGVTAASVEDSTSAPTSAGAGASAMAWSVEAAGVLDVNSLSTAAWGPSSAARVRAGRFGLVAAGLWLLPASVEVRSGQAVAFGLATGSLHACYRIVDARVSSEVCGGGELGRFSADGEGLLRDEQSFGAWWLAPSARLELATELGQGFGVVLRAEGLRPLLRETYGVNEGDVVYAAPPLAGRFYLGGSWSPGAR
jgi:hypothetical protein